MRVTSFKPAIRATLRVARDTKDCASRLRADDGDLSSCSKRWSAGREATLSFSRRSAVPKNTMPASQRANASPRKRSHTWRDCTTGCTVITLGARATIGSMAGCARWRSDCDSRLGTSQVSILPERGSTRWEGHAAVATRIQGHPRFKRLKAMSHRVASTFWNDQPSKPSATPRVLRRNRTKAAQMSGSSLQTLVIAHPARRGRPSRRSHCAESRERNSRRECSRSGALVSDSSVSSGNCSARIRLRRAQDSSRERSRGDGSNSKRTNSRRSGRARPKRSTAARAVLRNER